MWTVKVYINDVFHCTVPEQRVEGLLRHMKAKGFTNIRIGD